MAVEYHLSVVDPHTHLLNVEMRIAAAPRPLELVLPVWTPGSYLIREFARNVQDLEAHDVSGLPLGHRKASKNRWVIDSPAAGPVTLRYRVYANELSVRTSHLDSSHAFINGASVFMYVVGAEGEPVRLRIAAPPGWRVATTLHETESGEFLAEDYDELIDCPLEIGPHRTLAWVQEGAPHRFAIWGEGEIDEARLIADTRAVVDVCSELFGGLPYDRYLFLVHIVANGRGGLEHRNSCALHVAPTWLAGDEYESFVALIAHEFFHVWLGKRIRPEPLGPFDYSAENYTRHLWVVEGFTTYYTDRLLLNGGLISSARYLERLGDSIARLQATPGRHHQSLEESSFDTWIRFYRPDAHTPNAQISYYHKGALVAMVLDLEIRAATGGTRSLDDVVRALWERYGALDVGFPEATGIEPIVREIGGGSVAELLNDYVRGTSEIDFDGHLALAGLGLASYGERGEEDAEPPVAAKPPIRPAPPTLHEWRLGIRIREEAGKLKIVHVLAGTPAYDAGLNAGDELLAVDDVRATAGALTNAVAGRERGAAVALTVLRRDRVHRFAILLEAEVPRRARIVVLPDATESERTVRERWLRLR